MQLPALPPKPLRLAAHVRACRSDDQVILLDLRSNKYLGVGGPSAAVMAHAVDGWPDGWAAVPASPGPEDLLTRAKPLLARGLLTADPVEPAPAAALDESTSSLNAEDDVDSTTVRVGRAIRILHSAATAAAWLRFRSLLWIATTVAARREQLERRTTQPASLTEVRDAVAAYEKLRPLILTTQDRCLHDSLALVEYLAHQNILARWVIGVQTRPFGAHSWVQIGAMVLNDHHDRVRKFRPILVV